MKPPALISLLWPNNNAVLGHYLVNRHRVVVTHPDLHRPELQQIVEMGGSRLEALEMGAAVAGDLDARLERLTELLAGDDWSACCAALGVADPGKFAECVAGNAGNLLHLAVDLVLALDQARERYHIELLVMNEDVLLVSRIATQWARRHGIPSLHLAHALPLGIPSSLHRFLHADHLAVFGARGTEGFLDSGIPSERIHITGNPAWDNYPDLLSRRAEVRRLVAGHLGLDVARPIVVYAPSWDAGMSAVVADHTARQGLSNFLLSARDLREKKLDAQFVVKGHPGADGRDEALLDAVRREVPDCPPVAYTRLDAREVIVACDVTVSSHSNFAVESLLAGTLTINLLDEAALRLGNCFDAGSGVLEILPDDLAATLVRALTDPAHGDELRARMSEAASHFNAGFDGRAAQRVAELMASLARPLDAGAESGAKSRRRLGYVWEQLSELEDADLKGAYHDHARKELLLLLERPPRRVLDVGCATGATGELIKTAWPESHVTGIELNRAAAARAEERIDKVLGEKLEDIDFAAEGIAPGSIDTVLLADVLEHLYDPWDALLRIHPLLTEDAQVLVSLPNARNLWLLNELAGGRFPYASEGLLDITHIRWFTRAEMEKMLRETGYRVVKSGRTPTAGLQDLTRPPGSTTVETEKIVLKNVDDEEFEDLKALQIMFLAKPLKDAEAGATAADLYHLWQLGHSYLKRDALWIAERMDALPSRPVHHLAVIVPPGGEDRLANNIKSLGHQFYQDWKLTIVSSDPTHPALADTAAIAWIQAPEERHLEVANRALLETESDWVGMWEAGDKLAPHALFAFADKAARHPEFQVLYSDEDRVDGEDAHSTPFFKTDFNLEMLRAAPFVVGGLLLLRRDLFTELNGYDTAMEGVEAFDLTLRAWEKVNHAGIGHLADVLYHRHAEGGHGRLSGKDVGGEEVGAAHRRALEQHLARCGLAARLDEGPLPGTLHVRYPVEDEPLVSILVPTKNQVDFLKRCLTSLIDGTGYANCEILVLDNGSDEREAVAYLDELKALNSPRLKVLDCSGPFNFSAINNRGAREATGEYLVLLNNDTAVLHEEWLEEMLGLAQQPDVGAVGAKLFYPDGKIQHAGVILGMNDTPADHPFIGQAADVDGYFGRLKLTQEFSAVTAACMLVKRERYLELGGLDEQRFQVSFNDVDFCQRLRHKGYRNVFTPYARLLHEGSVSQTGGVETRAQEAKQKRFLEEQNRFYDAWRRDIAFDPAFNRNLSTHGRDFLIEIAPALAWDPEWRPRSRILAHPADRFGCGEYRVIAPMRALNDAGHIMGWETGNYLTPPELFRMEPDTILLQRQVDSHQIELIERYIRHSKAFRVYEIDDLITNIPIKSIRKQAFVEQKDLHKRFRKGISLCHRFIVSTDYLAEQYQGYCNDIVVLPNYIERARWGDLKPARRHGARPRVGWAGSATHDGDLAVIFDVVKATAREVDWVFLGMCPDEIRPLVAEFHKGVNLEDYPAKLASLDLDLAVAPLEDVPFNHGKSHLRLLEYGVLGYPVVCSDLTPYRGDYPVTRVPNRYKNWVEAIRSHVGSTMADRDELARRGDTLREYIHANWLLEDHLDVWLKAWRP
ncbi:MAG: glycosyltransferase [Gallionellaceae bacterium]|nr:glycosyltransferase [Gallionellaceae bacterium]